MYVPLASSALSLQYKISSPTGVLKSDKDWAENGTIIFAREIQSEYWTMKQFSLFIQITAFLVTSYWVDRTSPLPLDTEVFRVHHIY